MLACSGVGPRDTRERNLSGLVVSLWCPEVSGIGAAAVATNVLGTELEECGLNPVTGFYRDGCCNTGAGDLGVHTVCAVVTDEFLEYSKRAGNDLSTPNPEMGFPGLRNGDPWCLCATRWQEAFQAGVAPGVRLRATHLTTLEWVRLADLQAHAIDHG